MARHAGLGSCSVGRAGRAAIAPLTYTCASQPTLAFALQGAGPCGAARAPAATLARGRRAMRHSGGRHGMIEGQVEEYVNAPPRERPAAPTVSALASAKGAALRERLATALATDAVRVPLAVFLISRLYVFLVGAIAMQIDETLPPVAALGYFMPELTGLAHYLLQPWRNWDGHWYTLAAHEGYSYDRPVTVFSPSYA